jgi:hypothetical protein
MNPSSHPGTSQLYRAAAHYARAIEVPIQVHSFRCDRRCVGAFTHNLSAKLPVFRPALNLPKIVFPLILAPKIYPRALGKRHPQGSFGLVQIRRHHDVNRGSVRCGLLPRIRIRARAHSAPAPTREAAWRSCRSRREQSGHSRQVAVGSPAPGPLRLNRTRFAEAPINLPPDVEGGPDVPLGIRHLGGTYALSLAHMTEADNLCASGRAAGRSGTAPDSALCAAVR